MREKRDCRVVQDLLPNYIEKLTNEETNIFIEEHLKSCEECKAVLESMKRDLKVDTQKVNTKGIKIFKKYNKELRLFRNLLLLIIVVYVIIVGYRFAVLTSINSKATDYIAKTQDINNLTNYHSITRNYKEDQIIVIETYLKNKRKLSTLTVYRTKDMTMTTKLTGYDSENEGFFMTETDTDKEVKFNHNYEANASYSYTTYNYAFERAYMALTTSIHKVNLKGKECYLVKERKY